MERKEGIFGAAGAATLGAERIRELHSKVQLLKTNEQEMRREIDDLGNERRKLEKVVKDLERERDMALKKADEVLGNNCSIELVQSHCYSNFVRVPIHSFVMLLFVFINVPHFYLVLFRFLFFVCYNVLEPFSASVFF